MSISWLLVLLGLAVLGGAVWALFWAIDSGQFDDLEQHGSAALEEEKGDQPQAGRSA
jgi:cbb3-type cytochrome oxidase maturation protein